MKAADELSKAAHDAFPLFSRSTGAVRAGLLRGIATGIEALGPELVACVVQETSLPAARIESERARTCAQLRLFANLAESDSWTDLRIDRAEPDRKPQPRPEVRSVLRPVGPVAVFGASNFPLAFSVAGGDTASALAVGCPVVVKAHPAHPATSKLVGRAIEAAIGAAGLPRGTFGLLSDTSVEAGLALIRSPFIKAGAFTGSRRGGTALWKAAMERPEPISFFAEMSSVNPVFLFPEALEARGEGIATGLAASITLGVGQFCTKPGLIFLRDDDAGRKFLDRLSKLVEQTPCAPMLTPAIHEQYERDLAKRANLPGIEKAWLGPVSAGQGRPALLLTRSDAFLKTPEFAQEIFGPCSLAILCPSTESFVGCAEALEGQLTATLWGEERELAAQADFIALLEQQAGRLVACGFPTGVEVGTATVHGGPFPATTDSRFTSVGTRAIQRFVRPVAYQNFPDVLLGGAPNAS